MDPIDAQNAHFNFIKRNVNVGGGKLAVTNAVKVMRTCVVEENVDLFEDPGFVDLASLDLRLRDDAPVFAAVPGFQAPDFGRMGLCDDPHRASPAVKFGPHVSPLSPIMTPEARSQAERPLLVSVPQATSAVVIDGDVRSSEWPTDNGQETALLNAVGDAQSAREVGRIWLRTDLANLFVACEQTLSPETTPTTGANWGHDDGVEIVLAPAHDERLPNRLEGIVLRGFANGTSKLAEGSVNSRTPTSGSLDVEYASAASHQGRWSAEFRIPFALIGFDPAANNWPVFCHVTAYNASTKQRATWRTRWTNDPFDAKCATALCFQQFGPIPFMPGYPASAIRIDVQGDRQATRSSMSPADGTTAPDWAVKWNRLLAQFGNARADRWTDCRFEFLPLEDATVRLELMGTQSPSGSTLAWTYYDDFRVEGAELVNGDFETIDTNGRVAGWNCELRNQASAVAERKASVVEQSDSTNTPNHAALVSHDYRISQSIQIKQGQKVVVSFRARAVLTGM